MSKIYFVCESPECRERVFKGNIRFNDIIFEFDQNKPEECFTKFRQFFCHKHNKLGIWLNEDMFEKYKDKFLIEMI
jgi:hypothetical protein